MSGETTRQGQLLSRNLEDLGLPVPVKIPDDWRKAAAHLLAEHTTREIETVIRWLARDEFWRTRITHMPALRKEFPRLIQRARDENVFFPIDGQKGTPSLNALLQGPKAQNMRKAGCSEDEIRDHLALHLEAA